jgi:nucleoporin GLE1
LKYGVMKKVKADKQLKKEWGDIRRQITPKIGQLTNDDESISLIVRFPFNLSIHPTNQIAI